VGLRAATLGSKREWIGRGFSPACVRDGGGPFPRHWVLDIQGPGWYRTKWRSIAPSPSSCRQPPPGALGLPSLIELRVCTQPCLGRGELEAEEEHRRGAL
jgi:hypothetical protein